MTTKVKKKASSKAATKNASKSAVKSASKTAVKSAVKSAMAKVYSKNKSKAAPVNNNKPLVSKAKATTAQYEDDLDFAAEDFYSVTDGLTITAPSQPLEYKVLVGDTAEDLTRKVNELLYVAWDGTVWVPVGGLSQVSGKWAQAMARFE
jgi:hypothetical protein